MLRTAIEPGITVAYLDEGGRGDEPLLLLAPMGRSSASWGQHIPRLAGEFRCIAPDYRGTGGSDWTDAGYHVGQFAVDALSLLDVLEVDSAHIAGSSMGSAVAMEAALRAPERIRSLSLYTPWARTDNNLRGAFELIRALTEYAPPIARERGIGWLVFSPSYLNSEPEQFEQLASLGVAEPQPPLHAMLGHIDAGIGHDVLGRLGTLDVPTLVVAGGHDRLIPACYADEVAAAIPGARYHRFSGPASSHGLALEQLDEFLDVALAFLNEHREAR
ncbi:MAG: alpha/beta fold hydrolase [Thermoleophilia bacterium]|nr:alpha/beta fold hydrolase [Thermoleophilia bacterium]